VLKFVIIGAGGCLGAIFRYLVAGGVQSLAKSSSFPFGTMTVNVTGCLLIGIGGGLMENRQLFSPEWRAFLFLGMLGSFTTFSTFSLETLNLVETGQAARALVNILASVTLCIGAAGLGVLAARQLRIPSISVSSVFT